ncbi:RluA family pseudouridine synthase [Falsiroseomonas sp. E2-1-a4]|uniref:RluA family pseudouridine synthase n=1 Tax=Falsiroseomonas sp. E2-1-a4 TaxID=3239299 RepID=UPI003F36F2DD
MTPITPTSHLSAATQTPLSDPDAGQTLEILAPPEAAGLRADRFLTDALAPGIGGLSRSRVKALIESGQAMRDGVRVHDPAEPVRPGARYTLHLPPPDDAVLQPQDIPLTILFEDRHLIVLDKPAGLVVHPAPGNRDGTLVNAVLAHAAEDLTGIGGEKRPGIVHRLDKDTSGVMVVAKSERAHTALSLAFANRDLDREYLALVWGLPSPVEGEIVGDIGRHPMDRKRMAVVTRNGKHALTRYRTERAFGTSCALLRCRLATGRTHQIRVHLAHIGHPVVGDPVYLRRIPAAARNLAGPAREMLTGFPRQALHAATLGFNHPVTGAALSFSAELPPDMAALIACLDGNVTGR